MLELWKKYLAADPTRWLLVTDEPAIVLWYQLEIAHRPEEAPGVRDTRERVLYSDAVQGIFAAQDESGYWGDPSTLAQPYYNATVWNLALLAELGIPRTSRRAHNACEFVLQNFLQNDGTFAGLALAECGYLMRALAYFLREDERVERAALRLAEQWREANDAHGAVMALWASSAFRAQPRFAGVIQDASEALLGALAKGEFRQRLCFPQFEPRDPLFALRVLAEHARIIDVRVQGSVRALCELQDSQGRFPLMESLNGRLAVPLEAPTATSRWITLNALRVIAKAVELEQKTM